MSLFSRKSVIAIFLIGFAMIFAVSCDRNQEVSDCGTISVAEMDWASAEMFANLDKVVLEKGFGCDVELVPGSTQPTTASMVSKGEPDVAPEMWANANRIELDKAVDEGKLHYGAMVLSSYGEEGWWIPQYLADANPDIQTVEDALARPDLFPHPEGGDGALHTCPSGWNCQISTGNLFKAFDAESKGFRLVDPGSGAGLDGSIAEAYNKKQGWMGYYWAPTAILGKYPMKRLDFGVPFDADEWANCTSQDCGDPKKNSWVLSEVFTYVTDRFKNQAGSGAMDYMEKRALPNTTVNEVLAWMADQQASGEDAALYFLKNYSEWHDWVDADTRKLIEAAI